MFVNFFIKMTKSKKHVKINKDFTGVIYGKATFANVFIHCCINGNNNYFVISNDTLQRRRRYKRKKNGSATDNIFTEIVYNGMEIHTIIVF